MNIPELLNMLSIEELKQLENSIQKGSIRQAIEQKKIIPKKTVCTVCGQNIQENKGFRLEFGPKDFRKKAHFCATDCLVYFLNYLKNQNNGKYY